MNRWRQAFDRIGGPDAVTWPAFWVTFAANVIGHLTTGGAIDAPIALRLLFVAISQVAMFVPLVLLRMTVLRDPVRPLPWVAVGGFLIAAVIRGVVLTSLLLSVDAVSPALWAYRIAASLQTQAVLLFVMALVVSAMRAHTRSLERLVVIQEDLGVAQEQTYQSVIGRNEEALVRVQERLRAELETLNQVRGEESVNELQRLATDVVRPMSHDLATAVPAPVAPRASMADAHVTFRQVAEQFAAHQPFRPAITALVMGSLIVTASLGVFGMSGIPLILSVFATVLVFTGLANFMLRWGLKRVPASSAVALVLVSALVVGIVAMTISSLFLPDTTSRGVVIVGGGLFVAGVAVLSALLTAVFRQQRASEISLQNSTAQLRRELVRLRQAQWVQQKALSRALHGPVQSAVTAAALRLDAAVRAGDSADALLADVRQSLTSVIDVLDADEHDETSFEVAVERVMGMWEGVCEVVVTSSEDVRPVIDGAPIASTVLIDLVTEAVSNAVRHGGATHVVIELSLGADEVIHLKVHNDGTFLAEEAMAAGLGTQLLNECTMGWSRSITSQGYELMAVLPYDGNHGADAREKV